MILVTGATGNIGGEVLRQLVEKGQRVRVLSRDPSKVTNLGKSDEVVRADFTRPETLATVFAGCDKAFIVAGAMDLPSVMKNVAPLAKAAGVKHVVLVSSGTVDFPRPTAIGNWHREAEETLKASGVAWTMLRPNNFSSNALRWAGMIRSQGAVFSPGGGKSAPIDPRDIASVGVVALTTPGHEGKAYTIDGPELLTAAEQVAQIGAAIGKSLRFVEVPVEGARAGMLKSGMSATIVDAILELVGGAGHESRPSTAVRDLTGREARTFAQWARDNAAAFA